MSKRVDLTAIYISSDDVVAREVEGEMLIVPLMSGIGDSDEDLFTMNEEGRSIWGRLDGAKRLEQIVSEVAQEYGERPETIRKDVEGFVTELLNRNIVTRKQT